MIPLPNLPSLARLGPAQYETFQALSRMGMTAKDVLALIAANGGAVSTAGLVRADGTTPLTASWNAGAFPITSMNSEDCIQASEYGVVANGSLTVSGTGTDQTANMVAALTAAITAGKKLRLPSGVIKFTQNVAIPDVFGVGTKVHINVEGAGVPSGLAPVGTADVQVGGTMLKFWTGVGVHGLSLVPTNSIPLFTLKNIEIQGPDDNTTATSGDGLHIIAPNTTRINLENVDINHFGGGKGFNINGPENSGSHNISASFCDVGVSLTGAANANSFINTAVQYCHTRGIEVVGIPGQPVDALTFTAGLVQSNDKTGVYVSGAVIVHLIGFHFENNNTTSAVGCYAFHSLANNANGNNDHVTLDGCWFALPADTIFLDATGAAANWYSKFRDCRVQSSQVSINSVGVAATVFDNSDTTPALYLDNGTSTSKINTASTTPGLQGNMIFGQHTTTKGMATTNVLDVVTKWGVHESSLTLATGANQNIVPTSSFVAISGPLNVFSIGGIAGGTTGQMMTFWNLTNFTMTVNYNDAGSSVGNRINTSTTSNVACGGTFFSWFTVQWSAIQNGWVLLGHS